MSEEQKKFIPAPDGASAFHISVSDSNVIFVFGKNTFEINQNGSVSDEAVPEWTHSFMMSMETANEISRVIQEVIAKHEKTKASATEH